MLKGLSALLQYSSNVPRENPQIAQIAQKRSSKATRAAQSVSSAQSADNKCPAGNGIIASDVRIGRRACSWWSQGDTPFPKMFTAVVSSPDVRLDGPTTMKQRYETKPSESLTVSSIGRSFAYPEGKDRTARNFLSTKDFHNAQCHLQQNAATDPNISLPP